MGHYISEGFLHVENLALMACGFSTCRSPLPRPVAIVYCIDMGQVGTKVISRINYSKVQKQNYIMEARLLLLIPPKNSLVRKNLTAQNCKLNYLIHD